MSKKYYKVRKDKLDAFISGTENLYFIVSRSYMDSEVLGTWSDGEADTYDSDYFEDNFEPVDPPAPNFMLQLTTVYTNVDEATKAGEDAAAKLGQPVQVIHV